jgi:preprotein translocase subunit SecG
VQEGTRLEDMIAIVRSNRQEVFLPVVSAEGIFKGMARPRELLAQLADVVRPTRVGGMAMLVGVHLHCGTARGGSGDLALMLSGAFLMVVVGTAWVLSFLVCWFLERRVGVDLVPMLLGSPDVVAMGEGGVLSRVIWILPFLFFLILLRFSRLSQYHAAEHMVVHALERFEPLTEEGVARMGRVHPRCGSNLMVPVFILYLAWALWPMEYKYYFVGVIIAVVFLARNFGGVAQAVFTTRKPERRHIRKAIGAASELLRNYQRRGRRSVWLGMRVWNMGILQTLLGAFAAYGVYYAARALIEAAIGI